MESARREAMEEHWAPGMAIDEGAPAEHHDEGEVDVKEAPTKKIPQRKTQAQRKKAARSLAEVYLFMGFIVTIFTWRYRNVR